MKIHVEVYLASRLLARQQDTFTPAALIAKVEDAFGDTRPGVSTHASGHAVANTVKNTGTAYNYLWRIDTGQYRCFDHWQDVPHPSRRNGRRRPETEDVPLEYRHLLEL